MAKRFDAREISRALDKAMLDDFGETGFAIIRNFIFGSPVGNPSLWQNPVAPPGYVGGHFRRNWIVSIGGFNETEVEGVDQTGASTAAIAKGQINRYTSRRRVGPNLVIQNNVPYANRLANGWSSQAATGWIDRAIDLGLALPAGRRDLP